MPAFMRYTIANASILTAGVSASAGISLFLTVFAKKSMISEGYYTVGPLYCTT